MTAWGDLEIYLEFPLTLLSVLAIALSYGLIVLVLRQQRKKMNKHAKPKVNQVAPLEDDKAAGSGSSGNASAKVTLLDSTDKASKTKTEVVKDQKKSDKPDNGQNLDGVKDKVNSVSIAEDKEDREDKKDLIEKTTDTGSQQHVDKIALVNLGSNVIATQNENYAVVERKSSLEQKFTINTGGGKFENGETSEKTHERNVEEMKPDLVIQSVRATIPSDRKMESIEDDQSSMQPNINDSDKPDKMTEINSVTPTHTTLSSNSNAGPSPQLNANSPSVIVNENNVAANDENTLQTVSLMERMKRNAFSFSDAQHLAWRIKDYNKQRWQAKQRLGQAIRKMKVRSMSSPLFVTPVCSTHKTVELTNNSQKDQRLKQQIIGSGQHSAPPSKPPLYRSKTENSGLPMGGIFYKTYHVPYFALPEDFAPDSPSSVISNKEYFRSVEFSHFQQPEEAKGPSIEPSSTAPTSVIPTDSGCQSSKQPLSECDQMELVDRKISSQSQISSGDTIDKDCISLKFETLLSSEDEAPLNAASFTNGPLESSVSSHIARRKGSMPSSARGSISAELTNSVQMSTQTTSSVTKTASSNITSALTNLFVVNVASPHKTKDDVNQTLPADSKEFTLPNVPESDSMGIDISIDKTTSATSPVPEKSDGKKVEVVEMDGTVHLEIIKTSPDAGNIDGAVCLMNPRNKEQGRRRVELKAALKIGLIFCCFVCLWMPMPVSVLVMRAGASWSDSLEVEIVTVFSALASSTAAVDPILYGLLNRQIRSAFLTGGRKAKRKFVNYFKT